MTLFGESAGSFSVMHQLVSPWSAGLFHRAIAQSGAPFATYFGVQPPNRARRVAEALASSLGCDVTTGDNGLLKCLKAQSMEDIQAHSSALCAAKQGAGAGICVTAPWTPVVDFFAEAPFLPDRPVNLVAAGRYSRVPVLLGVTSEEGIYSAGKYILQPDLFSQLNAEWDKYGPLFVFDTDEPTPKVSQNNDSSPAVSSVL